MAPALARAQECPIEDEDCSAGGACALKAMPYEEFIAAPPTSRSRRDIPPVAERPFDPDSGDKLLVRGFVVDGVKPDASTGLTQEAVNESANQAFLRFSKGEPEARMTVGQIVRIADEVTTFYRQKGYLVAKVFVPVQTVSGDAIVRLQALEGQVSDVVVEGAKKYSPGILRKPAAGLVGTTPQREDVETALLYSQDYPGVRLFGTFRAGAQPGETKLVLQVLEEDSFGYKFGVDNYGSEFTGTYRLRGDVFWKNPVGWGDQLEVTLLQSVAPENTTYGALRYRVPFGPRGFGVFVNASQNAFQITEDPFSILGLEGSITTYEGGMDWRHTRSRFLNMTAGLSYAQKMSELDAVGGAVQVSDDTIQVGTLDSTIERIDTRFKGLDILTARVRQGLGGDLTGSSATVDPDFTAYEFRYSRLQALAETQFMLFRLRTQATDSRLSAIEQFALAGPDGVRAYPVGEILRDKGVLATLEYRVQAPGFARRAGPFGRQWGDLLQLSLFGDYGQGKNAVASNSGNSNDAEVSGYGAGIQFGILRSFNFLLQGAKPISSRKALDEKELRVYGEFSIEF